MQVFVLLDATPFQDNKNSNADKVAACTEADHLLERNMVCLSTLHTTKPGKGKSVFK